MFHQNCDLFSVQSIKVLLLDLLTEKEISNRGIAEEKNSEKRVDRRTIFENHVDKFISEENSSDILSIKILLIAYTDFIGLVF